MGIDDAKFCNNAAEKCIFRTEYRICLFEKGWQRKFYSSTKQLVQCLNGISRRKLKIPNLI